MPKLGLISLGCAKNLVDSEHMLSLMRDAGWEITEDMSEADVGQFDKAIKQLRGQHLRLY